MDTLKAEKRSMETKAKRLRREGYVTGNVFGHDIEGSIPVKIAKNDAENILKKKKKGSQIILDVEGTQYDEMCIRDSHGLMDEHVQCHPAHGRFFHDCPERRMAGIPLRLHLRHVL